jgi:hypothetical protein
MKVKVEQRVNLTYTGTGIILSKMEILKKTLFYPLNCSLFLNPNRNTNLPQYMYQKSVFFDCPCILPVPGIFPLYN